MSIKSSSWSFFLDENLPKRLGQVLRAKGYPTTRAIQTFFPTPHSGIIVLRLPNYTSVADLVLEVMNALTMLAGRDLANQVYLIEPDQVHLRS